jgi:hypothetical protein
MSCGLSMIAAAALSCLLVSIAAAQFPPVTDPNAAEAKCQKGTGKAVTKFVGAKAKCVSKCLKLARDTSGPYHGCFSLSFYSDPATSACIFDPSKGAEAKARASIVKACSLDCPECYTSQDPDLCSTGHLFVDVSAGITDTFGPFVFCLENQGSTPSVEAAKCEDGTSKALVKFAGSVSKCYQKCNQNMLKGKIAAGSCDPPNPADPATQACLGDPLKGARAKAAAAIDKVCSAVPGATPFCYDQAGLGTGAAWVSIAEVSANGVTPTIACGP